MTSRNVRVQAIGCRKICVHEGSMSAKGELRLKFVTQTVPANVKSVPWFQLVSNLSYEFGIFVHTKVIHMWIVLLFINQCMKVPSAGIIFGYFFVLCLAISSSDNWGPGYLGPSLRSRAGWDGGVNLEGFSRTRGLEFEVDVFFLFEALRIVRDVEEGVERRVRHIAPLCGSRNRGIEVVGDML